MRRTPAKREAEVALFVAAILGATFAVGCGDASSVASPERLLAKGGPPADPPITVTFRDDGEDKVQSDGRVTVNGTAYVHGVCGVSATFNLTDARLDPDAGNIPPSQQGACGGTRAPRKIKVAFTDRVTGSPAGGADGATVDATFFKVNEVETVVSPVLRTAVVQGPGCAGGLHFNSILYAGSSDLLVSKGADTWTAATQGIGYDIAACVSAGGLVSYYHLPFSADIRIK